MLRNVLSNRLGRPRSRRACRLSLEPLESRDLLSSTGLEVLPSVQEQEANDTLDTAQELGSLSSVLSLGITGTIGEDALDVDWYQFTLERPAEVILTSRAPADNASFPSVLSLYNHLPDDFSDPFNPMRHRLLDQAEGYSPEVELTLAPGIYFVAVSGFGNRAFHPFLADSGYSGITGDYELVLQAEEVPTIATDGPLVLRVEPGNDGSITDAPFVVRLTFNRLLDSSTIVPGDSFRLTYSATGDFDRHDPDVPLFWHNYSASANELRLAPAAPLAPGHYQIFLAGDASFWPTVIRAEDSGPALGATLTDPAGQDFFHTFQVTGRERREGADAADDTPSFANQLGDITNTGLVQVAGAIGDDPFYDALHWDPVFYPGNDVDLYHFQIHGGAYGFMAGVDAGRIGSPLDSGISLFRFDPLTSDYQCLAGNNNTRNPAVANDGSVPLYLDSWLFARLSAGDYLLAVSSNFNTPSPSEDQLPENGDIFDLTRSHSGEHGSSTGPYVLSLGVYSDDVPPEIVATTPTAGEVVEGPPRRLTVQFSEMVNLPLLAFEAFQHPSQNATPTVFIERSDGVVFIPRLNAYDPATNQATFVMLDGLTDGDYRLQISGHTGLTDLAGNPLVGNDPSGDFVLPFTVRGAVRGEGGDPHQWIVQEPNDDPAEAQNLGPLFSRELEHGIAITRRASLQEDTTDYFQLEFLQDLSLLFTLTGDSLPNGVVFTLTTEDGSVVPSTTLEDGRSILVSLLPAGTYRLQVSGWLPEEAGALTYRIGLALVGVNDNPPPLLSGPASPLALRLNSARPPSSPPPRVDLGSNSGPPTTTISTSDAGGPLTTFGGIPSSLLLSLRAGPLGGSSDNNSSDRLTTSAERVVIPTTTATVVWGLYQLLFLTQPGDLEGSELEDAVLREGQETRPTPPPTENANEWLRGVTDFLKDLIDGCFRLPDEQGQPDVDDPQEEREEESFLDAEAGTDQEWASYSESEEDVVLDGWLVSPALVVAGAVLLAERQPKRRHPEAPA